MIYQDFSLIISIFLGNSLLGQILIWSDADIHNIKRRIIPLTNFMSAIMDPRKSYKNNISKIR